MAARARRRRRQEFVFVDLPCIALGVYLAAYMALVLIGAATR